MGHDQLFKDFLRAFLKDFLELVYPELAERLDFKTLHLLDKELFTDFPEGKMREAPRRRSRDPRRLTQPRSHSHRSSTENEIRFPREDVSLFCDALAEALGPDCTDRDLLARRSRRCRLSPVHDAIVWGGAGAVPI